MILMRLKYLIHLTGLFLLFLPVTAQEVPFTRGINLTNWYQVASPYQIQLGKYTLEDFTQIQSLGCDVIRLPINLHAMAGRAPDYILDPLFLDFLDQTVDMAEMLGIYLILDNHTFDPAVGTDPNIGTILEKVWTQMAEHYQHRTEFLIYEVLNEPHDISDQQWNSIQQGVVDAIRSVDDTHYIVIGPAGWNSFHNLDAMPVYAQEKLIYTFHFYDPFIFTHQGASWTDPSMAPLGQVPFPYDANNMPAFPGALTGTWLESAFNDYPSTGTVTNVKSMIDIAVAFRNQRGVPIYCGEFGAYIPNSNQAERVVYYETVRSYLEEKDIPWTMWDYHGGFGIFREGGNGLFEHDLNTELLEALGFNVPSQTPFVKQPEINGFPVYTDHIEGSILESSSGGSIINYYSEDSPNNGKYCLRWEDGPQYQHIGFDLSPNLDLTELVNNGFALDFIFRATGPLAFDLRFIDSDTGTDDHPWRMNFTLDENAVAFDSRWHHVHIPLSDFVEGGAWEGSYFPPEGKFDWSDIERLEIVAEHSDLGNTRLWFDNLMVTNLDTAQVHDESVFELVTSLEEESLNEGIRIYPNPAVDQIFIKTTGSGLNSGEQNNNQDYTYSLIDGMGRMLQFNKFRNDTELDIASLRSGFYIIRLTGSEGKQLTQRFIKQ
ncbi:MAG: hypothetical protein DHS20C17_09880 [Cyclobacteriaceae bacterium]|nr:MAG: hypothetical protein DHS20C17_09880 [Cyclobacteriaceae bacterium]